jgi:hypothetical protein
VATGADARFTLEVVAQTATRLAELQLLIYSVFGTRVAMIDLRRENGAGYHLAAGQAQVFRGIIPALPLIEGDYRIGIFYNCNEHYADVFDVTTLTVAAAPAQDGRVPYKAMHRGLIALATEFESHSEPG